ncbi:hypothetical protein EAH79_11540 [Sphingomonas koreensis]|nr:hypothetical protein EAH79_11540 [Sphingomonas koreensis]
MLRMTDGSFVDGLGPAMLAHRLRRLSDTIVRDVGALLRERGLQVPPRAASLMMLLAADGEVSIMIAAQRLGLSHPMVINLARALDEVGLVEDVADPGDHRKRRLRLTEEGRGQAGFLVELNGVLSRTFEEITSEAGISLFTALEGFETVAASQGVLSRARSLLHHQSPNGQDDNE